MKKLTVGVGFTTDNNGSVENFTLEFSKSDLEKIKKCQSLIKEQDLSSIDILFDAKSIEHDSDFTPESTTTLKIFSDCVYFCCDSDFDGSIKYESEQIPNENIGL